VHVTHLINHTAVLLEEVQDLGIPIVATFTDFFGFCLTNRLEAADGTLCEGPRPDRSNCVACAMKAMRARGDAGQLGRFIPRGSALRLAAAGVTRASRLPIIGGTGAGRAVNAAVERPGILARAYGAYRAAITPTRFLRSAYERNGIAVPMYDINFGIDLSRDPKPERPDSKPLVIGYIGQLAPHKGVDLLVDAFVALGSAAAELHIFGAEDQEPEYAARLRLAAEGRAIHFRGTFPKEQMAAVLSELDLLTIPSRWYENSPLVLLNALASHTPVLVSDVEGMTEFVEPHRNGFTFQRSDGADLTNILRGIVADPNSLRAMARSTEYPRTTRTMAENVLAVYEQVGVLR
jgi:glycosyltransferase involved in cell wall biosynthesis